MNSNIDEKSDIAPEKKWILSIDPGSSKIGYAVIYFDLSHGESGVEYISGLSRILKKFCLTPPLPEFVVVGCGTSSALVCRLYNDLGCKPEIKLASEKNSTLKARARYFNDNPPRGIWRLVPRGLQTPSRPVDDYAAMVIGEEYLKKKNLHTVAD